MYQPNMATQQPVYAVNQQIASGQQIVYSPVGPMPSIAIANPQPVATINDKGSEAPPTYFR